MCTLQYWANSGKGFAPRQNMLAAAIHLHICLVKYAIP